MNATLLKYVTPVILAIAGILETLGLTDIASALKEVNVHLLGILTAGWAIYEAIRGIFLHNATPPVVVDAKKN